MKVNGLIVIKKNYKNSKFRSQVVELCRSGIFSDQQLLSQPRGGRLKFLELHLKPGIVGTCATVLAAGLGLIHVFK